LMSELTFAPSFRFANAMDFRLLRMHLYCADRGVEEEWAPANPESFQARLRLGGVATGALSATQTAACTPALYDRRKLRRFRK